MRILRLLHRINKPLENFVCQEHFSAPRHGKISQMRRGIIAGVLVAGGLGLLFWWYAHEMRLHANCEGCANNLRTLGSGMQTYAYQHDGHWPDSLAELMRASGEQPVVFVCPAGPDTPAGGADANAQANNLTTGAHLSYVYIAQGLIEPVADSAHVAVAYDREPFHGRLGLNVLFADGHVQSLRPAQAKRFLAGVRSTTRPIRWPPL